MSKKCPICGGGIGVYQDYVGGTSFFRCDICGHTGCDFEDVTVFDQITQSYETLAEKLVYEELITEESDGYVYRWRSTILPNDFWYSEEKAVAATVAKLKEVTK